MEKIKVYGIPNCDTTKKALNLLKENKTAFDFHDYKQGGISRVKLEQWCKAAGLEAIFNKRSTTWRELGDAEQKKVTDQASAIDTMIKHNSIIKRPIIEAGNKLIVGFDKEDINKIFK
ncbi:MAG: Spx/MgsR family RNA polymerase-binding regulatory protein [Ferruginibacter sp.]|nr:Spx/MgsR family RNA polymerase-binding regulatory protein [Ferruginibacter sp.]